MKILSQTASKKVAGGRHHFHVPSSCTLWQLTEVGLTIHTSHDSRIISPTDPIYAAYLRVFNDLLCVQLNTLYSVNNGVNYSVSELKVCSPTS